ncbi:thioredoxin-like [Mixophyes fleayi]|uniref:thioredoxin-like n=1 Tax=Mixophyes fleayi TaxID=3061075 RepID=UPI003F4E01E8
MVKCIESLAEYKALVESAGNKLLVIDFTAIWCGPCKKISPVFEELSEQFPNVLFYKVDVDDAEDVAAECGVRAMPTFQFYKGGQKVEELCGADADKLRTLINKLK